MSIRVSVKRLRDIWDPFESKVWPNLGSPITQDEIKKAIPACAPLSDMPKCGVLEKPRSRKSHVTLVAWLATHWKNDYPLEIDVGVFECPAEVVSDGNHRLAAAIYLRRRWVLANVSGSEKRIKAITF